MRQRPWHVAERSPSARLEIELAARGWRLRTGPCGLGGAWRTRLRRLPHRLGRVAPDRAAHGRLTRGQVTRGRPARVRATLGRATLGRATLGRGGRTQKTVCPTRAWGGPIGDPHRRAVASSAIDECTSRGVCAAGVHDRGGRGASRPVCPVQHDQNGRAHDDPHEQAKPDKSTRARAPRRRLRETGCGGLLHEMARAGLLPSCMRAVLGEVLVLPAHAVDRTRGPLPERHERLRPRSP
jgi:hypothetical protein